MTTRPYNLLLTWFTFALVAGSAVRANSERSMEYQIKAAFLYNFIKFVNWPEEKKAETEKPISIGIIGCEDFIESFKSIQGRKIGERSISVKYFAGYEKLNKKKDAEGRQWDKKIDALKVCDVLMFCSCGAEGIRYSDQIMKALKEVPILTVGEADDFLKSGGMINFIRYDEKIRFEINNAVARKAGLTIRSKLLRLAKKVIDDKTKNRANN